ncbi:MAG: CHASE domain-containing protein [Deltaproteobacteria bacterium]|nr:CHASE domain-containing protein [Deltaproteobacteria bacterium]
MAVVAGVVLTALGFGSAQRQQSLRIQAELARRSNTIVAAVQRELGRKVSLLQALSAFLVTGRGGTRSGLRSFTAELARDVAGVPSLDWAPRVSAEALKSFEEAQWVDGLPGFRIHRGTDALPQAPEYFPVDLGLAGGARVEEIDLTPGADLSGTPLLSPTVNYARTRRTEALSPPLRLQRSNGTAAAVLLLAPVFALRSTGAGAGQATEELLGFAFALLELDPLLDAALSDLDRASLSVELRDVAASANDRAVVRRDASSIDTSTPLLALLNIVGSGPPRQTHTIDIGSRQWALAIAAGPRFVAGYLTWTPWAALVCGLLASSLLGAFIRAFVVRSAELERVQRRLGQERVENLEGMNRLTEDLERERLERRRTEDSLFREKQQFRLMFNAVPAMIWYKDTKNRFLLVNESAAASMGHTVAEMEGKPCSQILPGKAYDLYRDDLEIIQSGRPKLGVIEELELAGGKSIWVRTDKLPEYDSMGRVVGLLVFAQDVSEHRHAEDEVRRLNAELEQRVAARTGELRAANQELESFAYSVSHDLRAPLRTIDGFSQLVVDEFGENLQEAGREHLSRIRAASQRMGHLIDDLLKLTRVSRSELRREEVDLSAMARQVTEELRHQTPQRRVDVLIEATPIVEGDPVLLLTAIQNLLENAWKFTAGAEEPRIEFGATSTPGGKTAFYVRDNGVGFDMVYADKLFGAFQRLHSRDEFEGSGIGLATVRLILRRHGGEVWAEGAAGKGATFYFTLP